MIALGFDASQAIHRYSIKWNSTEIRWLVDGVEKHSVLATSGAVLPTSEVRIFSNIWASKGVDAWTGAFVYANQPRYAYVDSILYAGQVLNNGNDTTLESSSPSGGGCLTFSTSFVPWSLLLGIALFLRCFYRLPR